MNFDTFVGMCMRTIIFAQMASYFIVETQYNEERDLPWILRGSVRPVKACQVSNNDNYCILFVLWVRVLVQLRFSFIILHPAINIYLVSL